MSRTIYSYFTGGDGVGVGARMAGWQPIGGVERDPAIAAVAIDNGFNNITVADVRHVDPLVVCPTRPDWFHASPVCKNASNAKPGGEESTIDIETAAATLRFIEAHKPEHVSIENVWGYRKFAAFELLTRGLHRLGYSFAYWHLNAANYGVPQTRERLILRARLGDWTITKPVATHQAPQTLAQQAEQLSLFGDMPALRPWVSWFDAVQDLIPTMPESKLAPWQLALLPDELKAHVLIHPTDQCTMPKALLIPGGNATSARPHDESEPSMTIGSVDRVGNIPRAILLGTQNQHGRGITARTEQEPSYTMTPKLPRAVVLDGQANDRGKTMTSRRDDEPFFTVSASMDHRPSRSRHDSGDGMGCKVVRLTPRALADLQSFPRSYKLPKRVGLAITVIGNAVPPLLMKVLLESI